MRFHLELARRYAEAKDTSLQDAARLLGRARSLLAHEFYNEMTVQTVVEVLDSLDGRFPEGFYRQGLDDRGESDLVDIEDGFRATMWADLWASAAEERGESFSGMDLTDIAPVAPPEAVVEASFVIGYIEGTERRTVSSMWEAASKAVEEAGFQDHRKFDTENFGSTLYFETVGAGVSWEDDFPKVPGRQRVNMEIDLDCAHEGKFGLDKRQALEIASSYASMMHAGDPGVILYSFSSLGGVVETEENRARLLDYLRGEIMQAARFNDEDGGYEPVFGDTEVEDVQALVTYVESIEVGLVARPVATPK